MTKLFDKFAALPRSMKWLVVFLVVLVGYFVIVEPVLDATNRMNQKADSLAAGLKKEADLLSPESPDGRRLADGRRLFGEPMLPGDPAHRPEAVHDAVDRILEKHGVTKRTKNERRVAFRGDELAALMGGAAAGTQQAAERLILDIPFEATPETVTAIVSELEQAKEITLVSKVEMRRPDAGRDARSGTPVATGKTLKVTVSLEAWILTSGAPGGGSR